MVMVTQCTELMYSYCIPTYVIIYLDILLKKYIYFNKTIHIMDNDKYRILLKKVILKKV